MAENVQSQILSVISLLEGGGIIFLQEETGNVRLLKVTVDQKKDDVLESIGTCLPEHIKFVGKELSNKTATRGIFNYE